MKIDILPAAARLWAIKTEGEIDPFLERNAELRKEQQKSDWGRHVASIPNIIQVTWLNEAWESGNTGLRFLSKEWMELVSRKLQDPEWTFLRVDGPRRGIGWGD